jgi:endoglucanase
MRAATMALALWGGCAQFHPPVAGGSAAPAPAAAGGCGEDARIDDGEDGGNQVELRGGRNGYLYTFKDAHGTRITPDGAFSTSAGGAHGSRSALRIAGKLADSDSAYAGLGLSFTDPKTLYDASRYTGIAFYARGAPGTTTAVRLKVPDVDTDPDGHVCKECYNDFGVDFQVTAEWTRYEVAFADLKQGSGWGNPRPAAIDLHKLFSLQWQVATRGGSFDLWIDDVTFVGCR